MLTTGVGGAPVLVDLFVTLIVCASVPSTCSPTVRASTSTLGINAPGLDGDRCARTSMAANCPGGNP